MVGTDEANRAEPPMMAVDQSERFLNLAVIEIGEALTLIGNLRQRGLPAKTENYALVVLKLTVAVHAVVGEFYTPPIAPQHLEIGKPGS